MRLSFAEAQTPGHLTDYTHHGIITPAQYTHVLECVHTQCACNICVIALQLLKSQLLRVVKTYLS